MSIKDAALQILQDGKAEDIVVFDLTEKNNLAPYGIVASGTSSRHIKSLADKLADAIRELYNYNVRIEGGNVAEWVVITAPELMVHLFDAEARRRYDLDSLWRRNNDATEVAFDTMS